MPRVLTSWFASLRSRLILLVLVAVLPAFGLLVYTGFEQRKDDRAAARAEALRLAQVVAAQQNTLVQSSESSLATLAGLTASANLESVDQTQCSAAFANILNQFPSFDNFGLVTHNGELICAAKSGEGNESVANLRFFQRAVESGAFGIGEYELNRATGRSALNFGYPVLDETGEVSAVYFASLSLTWLGGTLSNIDLPDGAVISILDGRGTVVARVPETEGFIGRNVSDSALGTTILSQQDGVAELPGLDGTERLYAFAPINDDATPPLYVSIGLPSSDVFAAANATLLRNLVLLGAVAILALAAAWFGGSWFVLGPVAVLSRTARSLASGHLEARTGQRHGAGELAELARTFDEMAEGLERKEEERHHAAEALRKNVSELAKSNADLEAFTYSVSHDLKEPLRTVEAFSQFMLEDYAEQVDEQGKDYLRKLAKASARMKRLIEDLLALSRIGKRDGPATTVAVDRIVAGVVEGMRATIEERRATVEVHDELPPVRGDAARVEQIFGNLISNALKFNAADQPRIDVGVREWGSHSATFYVKDNGIGIDAKYHELIFGVFQRLHKREEYEGTGAGLAIVKRAVETLGGQVWVESEVGLGATFLFALPVAELQAMPEAA